jgi:hypothetical protein
MAAGNERPGQPQSAAAHGLFGVEAEGAEHGDAHGKKGLSAD